MKKTIQVLAIILSLGATAQAFKAYAVETTLSSAEDEKHKIIQLMEIRKEIDSKGEEFFFEKSALSAEFPEITNKEELDEIFVMHTLQYIKAIGAEKTFIRVLKQPEVMRFIGSEPGI